MSLSCCWVCEGRVQVRAESGSRTRSPLRSGARGVVASTAASSTSLPTVLDGTGRPGILARLPYHVYGLSGPRVRRLTSLAARNSLHSPFMDPRGHRRACTGKRPVSRVEARLPFKQRRWWGSIRFRCTSTYAASPGCFSAPPLSHNHSRREPGEERRIRNGVVMIVRGRQPTRHTHTYIYILVVGRYRR